MFSKITQYLQEIACVGVFFSKVVGVLGCSYIKMGSNTAVLQKFAKIFKNIFFEKHLWTAASLSRSLRWIKVKKITERSQYFAIFTGKHLCWSLFLRKFIKKTLRHRCFPVNMAYIKSTCFEEHLQTTDSHGRHWYSTNEILKVLLLR